MLSGTLIFAHSIEPNKYSTMSESSVDLPPTYVEGFHDKQSVLKIKYNKLQGTDLVVSHISLGGGAFSKFYG